MATSQITLQTGPKLILDKEDWMEKRAKLRGCKTAVTWLKEMVEAERAAMRQQEEEERLEAMSPRIDECFRIVARTDFRDKLDQEQKAQMRALRRAGEKVSALAQRFNVSLSTARRALQEEQEGNHKSKLSAEDIQTVLHLRSFEHMSVPAIAARLGCDESEILQIFDRYDQASHVPANVQPGPNRPRSDADWDNA